MRGCSIIIITAVCLSSTMITSVTGSTAPGFALADHGGHRQLQLPDLPGNCQLFYLLEYDITQLDDESMDRFYKDDSYVVLAQAGAYIGKEAMQEYIAFALEVSPYFEFNAAIAGSVEFITYNDPNDDSNAGLCEYLAFTASRSRTTVELSVNNETVERPTLLKIYYDPQANKVDHVAVHYDPGWLTYFFGRLDTMPTMSFICDIMVSEACAESAPAAIDDGGVLTKEECVEHMSTALELAEGDLAYVDGKTRGCRMLHAVFAAENPSHCPHLSFEPQTDRDGKIKCQTSGGALPSDFFTPDDFDAWENFKVSFGLFDGEPIRVVGRDDFICPQGKRLAKNGKRCKKVCRRLDGLRLDKKTNMCISICAADEMFDAGRKKCTKKCKAADGVKFDEATQTCVPI